MYYTTDPLVVVAASLFFWGAAYLMVLIAHRKGLM